MRIRVESQPLRDALGRFRRVDEVAEAELNLATRRATEVVYRQTIRNIQRMFRNPGKMESALQMTIRSGKRPVGEVFIEGVEYVVHELGGLRSYTILPRSGSALKFPGMVMGKSGPRGGSVFAARVERDPLPQRSYLRRALDEKQNEIREIFETAGRNIASKTVRG